MSTVHHLSLPLTESAVRALALGDQVYLSGELVMTAGLPTHERIIACIERGEALPIDLQEQTLLQFGGYNRERDGQMEVLYINPTTSTRFSHLMPTLIRSQRLRAVGGKGGLDAACVEAMRTVGCVYLSFPGGACTLYGAAIREVVAVAWRDLIVHYRLAKLRVEELGPATVAIDAHGNSLYARLHQTALEHLPAICEGLDAARAGTKR